MMRSIAAMMGPGVSRHMPACAPSAPTHVSMVRMLANCQTLAVPATLGPCHRARCRKDMDNAARAVFEHVWCEGGIWRVPYARQGLQATKTGKVNKYLCCKLRRVDSAADRMGNHHQEQAQHRQRSHGSAIE